MTFASNKEAYKVALDEIIKYNQFVNEFNYLQEFHARMHKELIDGKTNNYQRLFEKYDQDEDSLLQKEDVRKMMVDSGMRYVTLAEASFVFNILAKHKKTMNLGTFENWARSLIGLTQKRLIQYSQYLDVATMTMKTDEDFENARLEQMRFVNAMRGYGQENVDRKVPDCVKLLVNEQNTLGETLMRHSLHRFGTMDGCDKHLITLEEIFQLLRMFHYRCTQVDYNELRFWVLNRNLIADAPEYYREDYVYIDSEKLMEELKTEYQFLG